MDLVKLLKHYKSEILDFFGVCLSRVSCDNRLQSTFETPQVKYLNFSLLSLSLRRPLKNKSLVVCASSRVSSEAEIQNLRSITY